MLGQINIEKLRPQLQDRQRAFQWYPQIAVDGGECPIQTTKIPLFRTFQHPSNLWFLFHDPRSSGWSLPAPRPWATCSRTRCGKRRHRARPLATGWWMWFRAAKRLGRPGWPGWSFPVISGRAWALNFFKKWGVKISSWLRWFGLFFPSIGNFIIPTDELIFFRGLKPPTSKRMVMEAQILVGFRLFEWALPNKGKSNQGILLGITGYRTTSNNLIWVQKWIYPSTIGSLVGPSHWGCWSHRSHRRLSTSPGIHGRGCGKVVYKCQAFSTCAHMLRY